MSKSLKKLIDINRLREFKNKLVGTGSAYVQTTAVDQTVAGTKTFSKPIVGSVTGSSGSCTGNAATATTATTAKACTGNAASATKLQTARTINGTSFNGTANITTANWGTARDITIADSTGDNTGEAVSVNGSGNVTLKLPSTINANITGYSDAVSTSVAADNTKDLVYARMADNDYCWIRCGGAADAGYLEIATGDNGGDPIYVRQNNSKNHSFRTLTLLDGSGNTQLPGTVTAPTFSGNLNGNCSGSSGSCTGNAATATKLAAKRTIALSGAATGTATGFDGSGNITIPVTALASSAIRAQWYAAYPDGAEAHNAMWGGRDITAAFNAGTVSEHIADGTFRDIFPGDYITKQVTISGTAYTVNWVIADCDYWINKGEANMSMAAHHVAIVPQQSIFAARMNPTNTTEGGYKGSAMYKNIIPACATGIVNAFGSNHILTFRDYLTQDLNTSAVSSGITTVTGAPNWGGEWHSQQCNLMSEAMVYDGPHCASSALDNIMATRQMSAFRLSERLINYNRKLWWLRDVASSANFALVSGFGVADTFYASDVRGVRPFALLR